MSNIVLVKKEESPKMKIKKQMLSRILRKAWHYKKTSNYDLSFGGCLQMAWEFEKKKTPKHLKKQFSIF